MAEPGMPHKASGNVDDGPQARPGETKDPRVSEVLVAKA